MLVIVNPTAGGGRALARWRALEPRVRELLGPFRAIAAGDPLVAGTAIARALAAGEKRFVAAGGDGTVNLVLSALAEHAAPDRLARLKLGAIGLGSSNDFHKPRGRERRLGDAPAKLDFQATVSHDVGRLEYHTPTGSRRSRFWIVNASIGVTAEGNRLFNEPTAVLRRLKGLSRTAAMAHAAARAVLGRRARTLILVFPDGGTREVRAVNLGVVKNPHFTGMLRYDSPYEPNGGRFYVHLLEDAPLPRLAATLLALARGRFTGRPGARSWRTSRLAVEAREPFAVEADGEVVTALRAEFSLMPAAIQVCT